MPSTLRLRSTRGRDGPCEDDDVGAMTLIDDGRIGLSVNIPTEYCEKGRPYRYLTWWRAADAGVLLFIGLKLGGRVIEAVWCAPSALADVEIWR